MPDNACIDSSCMGMAHRIVASASGLNFTSRMRERLKQGRCLADCRSLCDGEQPSCSGQLWPCRLLIFRDRSQRVLEGFHHSNVRWLCHGRAAWIQIQTLTSRAPCSPKAAEPKLIATKSRNFGMTPHRHERDLPNKDRRNGSLTATAVFLRLLGTVVTSTRADACAFSGEPQLPRAR